MEPALDERGDVFQPAVDEPTTDDEPQWSPLSTSGATRPSIRRRGVRMGAAMEPALDERGDPRRGRCTSHPGFAAMEPALDERGDCMTQVFAERVAAAAMEPALDER